MNFPFPLPLLLDGATGTNMMAKGMTYDGCTEAWIAEHPQEMAELQRAFIAAGSQALYTPTLCANSIALARHGLAAEATALNRMLAARTREVAGTALVGGCMGLTGELCEPFGDGHFLSHIATYAQQAMALQAGGVDFIVAETMTSLSEARAALIGARQSHLPILITLTVDERGRTASGMDALAAFITLQAMGAVAFGFNCCPASVVAEQLARIAPYAHIPLIAKPSTSTTEHPTEAVLTPRDFSAEAKRLLRAGAQLIGGCCGTTPEHIAAMNKAVREFNPTTVEIEHDECSLVVCGGTEVVFLSEDFELSSPLTCALDMADELLEAEDAGCDVLSIHIGSTEDAYCFAQCAHMARLPVSFLAESEEALEEALILYNGRALIDARSEVERPRLEELAERYGAVLR